MGIIGLAGVVVNDSIVLVSYLNQLRKRSSDENLTGLVAGGTADRLRAIMLTSITTIAALLPLAYGLGGTAAFMAPMALALGWGLLFATPLTLVLVPSLYLIGVDMGNVVRKTRKRKNTYQPNKETTA
jgi:multidrug efflux pump subunit AcrB